DRVEFGVRRHPEDPDLAQGWSAFRLDRADPRVQPVSKTDGLRALVQFDAVEDSAAHIAGALERILALTRDQDGMLAGLEACLELFERSVADQAAANGRVRNQRCMEFDEHIIRIAALGPRGRLGIARLFEGLVDIPDRE